MRDFSKNEIAKIKQAVTKKSQSFPQEWLGRALAYTPYQPRPLHLKKSAHFTPQNLYGFSENLFAKSQKTDFNEAQITFLQIAKNCEKEASAFLIESLEILTYIRRYVSLPLIYDFLILDSYQLLESLVYGADGVILLPKFLTQVELKDLSDYALKIGLERIFRIESKEDLTKAIFAKADILDLSGNLSLIPLIPNNKIILSEIPQEIPKNQENNCKALDTRILRL
ncbi:hypothetical protein [Helicobacter sp.]|uniref:hypothetical protein n=1 Tax=Helicobacter sp. TaxID=218 RepID=UPI0019C4CC0F|nr:hypothetical protein [Helicobacter sp.]MBD5164242.1 indole-3-glycerol-phosphate synthase TrpC [Helicobacter sp.]